MSTTLSIFLTNLPTQRYGWLSIKSIYPIKIDGKVWRSIYHYVQAKRFSGNLEEAIMNAEYTLEIDVLLGDKKHQEDPLWKGSRYKYLYRCLLEKFTYYPMLRAMLLEIEGINIIGDDPEYVLALKNVIKELKKIPAVVKVKEERSIKDIKDPNLSSEDIKVLDNFIALVKIIKEIELQTKIYPGMIEDAFSNLCPDYEDIFKWMREKGWTHITSYFPKMERMVTKIKNMDFIKEMIQWNGEEQLRSSILIVFILRYVPRKKLLSDIDRYSRGSGLLNFIPVNRPYRRTPLIKEKIHSEEEEVSFDFKPYGIDVQAYIKSGGVTIKGPYSSALKKIFLSKENIKSNQDGSFKVGGDIYHVANIIYECIPPENRKSFSHSLWVYLRKSIIDEVSQLLTSSKIFGKGKAPYEKIYELLGFQYIPEENNGYKSILKPINVDANGMKGMTLDEQFSALDRRNGWYRITTESSSSGTTLASLAIDRIKSIIDTLDDVSATKLCCDSKARQRLKKLINSSVDVTITREDLIEFLSSEPTFRIKLFAVTELPTVTQDMENGLLYSNLFSPHGLHAEQYSNLINILNIMKKDAKQEFLDAFVKKGYEDQHKDIDNILGLKKQ